MSTYLPRTESSTAVAARAVWALVHDSLSRGMLKSADPESIVRCRLCGSVFRLGDAQIQARGYVSGPDWSCVDPTCFGGLVAFVPVSAPEERLRLML